MTEITETVDSDLRVAATPARPRRRIPVALTQRLALVLSVGVPISALTVGGLIGSLLAG